MEAAIAGVYTHSKDGEEYITSKGNLFVKVLFVQDDQKNGMTHYESFFLTPAAHFRVEDLHKACCKPCPTADQLETKDFNALIGEKLEIIIGENKAGYPTIKKFLATTKPVIQEPVEDVLTDEISGQLDDDDLDEEIPF